MSFLAVLLASIIGSPHCASMCGGFVAFYSGLGTVGASHSLSPRERTSLHLLYNFGRMLTYVTLGGLAGTVGGALNAAGEFVGLQQLAAMAIGVLMIAWGLPGVLNNALPAMPHPKAGADSFWGGAWTRVLRFQEGWSGKKRALVIGLLSTFLPCGWLYSYVAIAAASGSLPRGMAIMFFFWLGTLPMMLSIGHLLQRFAARSMNFIPRVTSSLLVLAGLLALSGHTALGFSPQNHSAEKPVEAPLCHR